MERCRLCAKEPSSLRFKPITETSDVLTKIRKVLPIVVIAGDPLPQEICPVCEEKLNEFHNFYEETKRADLFHRSQLIDIPAKTPPVINPFLQFHDIHTFLTAAYSSFMNKSGTPKLKDYFIIKTIDQTTLFSCKTCKRTYLTEDSALRHFCNQETKPKSFVNLSSNPITSQKALPEVLQKVRREETGSDPSDGHHSFTKSDGSDSSGELQKSALKAEECISDASVRRSIDENCNSNLLDAPEIIWQSSRNEKEEFYFRRKKEVKSNRKRKRAKSREGVEREGNESEKEHMCEVCGKTFAYSAELGLHRGTHYAGPTTAINHDPTITADIHVQPVQESKHMYACSFCQLSFSRKTTLLSHEQDHLEKSFRDNWSDDGANA